MTLELYHSDKIIISRYLVGLQKLIALGRDLDVRLTKEKG